MIMLPAERQEVLRRLDERRRQSVDGSGSAP
jgi:hypothetical protein